MDWYHLMANSNTARAHWSYQTRHTFAPLFKLGDLMLSPLRWFGVDGAALKAVVNNAVRIYVNDGLTCFTRELGSE
ncbi:hypothetical protein EVAR_69379_1 [Eumeta japonica]|uniref:Uncharacterized protein n=1 Tax=Eumeta variegata TaxID=151549 RepID=A0A4C1ZXF0_EUMVA|nr:hypothetical protein EVAR_69379_1 [Eumeta japonica]